MACCDELFATLYESYDRRHGLMVECLGLMEKMTMPPSPEMKEEDSTVTTTEETLDDVPEEQLHPIAVPCAQIHHNAKGLLRATTTTGFSVGESKLGYTVAARPQIHFIGNHNPQLQRDFTWMQALGVSFNVLAIDTSPSVAADRNSLNTLAIDTGRRWKDPWRWFDESMPDCCEPLDKVKAQTCPYICSATAPTNCSTEFLKDVAAFHPVYMITEDFVFDPGITADVYWGKYWTILAFAALYLMSVGSALLLLGAQQNDEDTDRLECKQSFSWSFAAINQDIFIVDAGTLIYLLQQNVAWAHGLGIGTACMLLTAAAFVVGMRWVQIDGGKAHHRGGHPAVPVPELQLHQQLRHSTIPIDSSSSKSNRCSTNCMVQLHVFESMENMCRRSPWPPPSKLTDKKASHKLVALLFHWALKYFCETWDSWKYMVMLWSISHGSQVYCCIISRGIDGALIPIISWHHDSYISTGSETNSVWFEDPKPSKGNQLGIYMSSKLIKCSAFDLLSESVLPFVSMQSDVMVEGTLLSISRYSIELQQLSEEEVNAWFGSWQYPTMVELFGTVGNQGIYAQVSLTHFSMGSHVALVFFLVISHSTLHDMRGLLVQSPVTISDTSFWLDDASTSNYLLHEFSALMHAVQLSSCSNFSVARISPSSKAVFWALIGAVYYCCFGLDHDDESCQPKLRRQLADLSSVGGQFRIPGYFVGLEWDDFIGQLSKNDRGPPPAAQSSIDAITSAEMVDSLQGLKHDCVQAI